MLAWYWRGKRLSGTKLRTKIRDRKLILFGADRRRNQRLFEEIEPECFLYIFDNDEYKWGGCREGIQIVKPFLVDEDVVLISGIHDWKAISQQVERIGYGEPYFFLIEETQAVIGKYLLNFSPNVYNNKIYAELSFKYIHFIPDEKFFAAVLEFIEYGLEVREHFFIIYGINGGNRNNVYGVWGKYRELSEKYHNIYLYYEDRFRLNLYYWDDNRDKLTQLLEKADKIIFHGEFFTEGIYDFFCARIHLVKKKGVFIPWGGDIGENPYTTRVIGDILQYVRMIPDLQLIDKYKLMEKFPIIRNAIWLKSSVSYARLTRKVDVREENNVKNILIAHSPHDYTKAMETLQYLSGIGQIVQIYCIASYGPSELIDEIEKWGEIYFENCFHLLKTYMNYKEYVDFLSRMDIAVFGMELFSGRDTLELLFWLGKKVYLKPGSEADKRIKKAGYKVDNYYNAKKDIINGKFDNLNKDENILIAENEFNSDKKFKEWKKIYEYNLNK